MNFRKLGSSDIEVSEISLGSWLTYSGGVAREQAKACVDAAFDAGINFIDTANVYGRGAAETLLGEVLAGRERSSYVLATKVYFPMSDSDRGLSAAQIHKQIDASLERLRTDYVDLYQCHRYDADTPLEETMGALSEVVRAGKARHIGFSEWPGRADRELARAAGRRSAGYRASRSTRCCGAARRREVIPLCERERHLPDRVVAARAGRADRQVPPGRAAAGGLPRGEREHGRLHRPPDRAARARGGRSAWSRSREQAGLTMPQLALAWVLRQANVASAIVGASRPSRCTRTPRASGIVLSADTLAAIDEALGHVVVR